MRVFADIEACSLMVGATAVVGSLVAGARVLVAHDVAVTWFVCVASPLFGQ